MDIKKLLLDHFEEEKQKIKLIKEAEERTKNLVKKNKALKRDGPLTPGSGIFPTGVTEVKELDTPSVWNKLFSRTKEVGIEYTIEYTALPTVPGTIEAVRLHCPLFKGISAISGPGCMTLDAIVLIDWAIDLSLNQHGRLPDPYLAVKPKTVVDSFTVISTKDYPKNKIKGGPVKLKI